MPTITTEVSDYALNKEAEEIAKEIFDDVFANRVSPDASDDPDDWWDEVSDRAWEAADGHRWVIYTHHALMLCATCNTDMGEEFAAEEKFTGLSDIATKVAFGELRGRIEDALRDLIEDYEPPEGEPEEEDDE